MAAMIHIAIEAHSLDEEFEAELKKYNVTVVDRTGEPRCVVFAGERHSLIQMVRDHWNCDNMDEAEQMVSSATIKWPLARQAPRSGMPWHPQEDVDLQERLARDLSCAEIAQLHGRSGNAIVSRAAHLGLLVDFGGAYYKVQPEAWVTYKQLKEMG